MGKEKEPKAKEKEKPKDAAPTATAAPAPASASTPAPASEPAAAAPAEWREWYWICIGGIVIFIVTIFLMRGRWSPATARADEAEHDAAVTRELQALQKS